MIASSIGKKFLRNYNAQNGTSYSAKDFFVQIYFPLFYDHSKYMQWVTNSPFVQGIKKGVKPTSTERAAKLTKLQEKVLEAEEADASIAIGYPSTDLLATTSGQVTNLPIPSEEDEVYASWIGSGFGIGVQGGLSIFFDKEEILESLFKGWQLYREFLNTTPDLRPNQINTWNGQWLAHAFSRDYNPDEPTADFSPFEATKDGGMEVVTQSWVKVLFGIARKFPENQLTGYVYNLGQTNTTLGFIPFNLPKLNRPIHIYRHLFGENQFLEDYKKFEQLFGTAFGFSKACQMGAIGVAALEPKGLRGLIPSVSGKSSMPNYDRLDDTKRVTYNTYITWILAMLDNEKLWDEAGKVATIFCDYQNSATKGRTIEKNQIKTVLESVNKKAFIENLIPLVQKSHENEEISKLAKIVNNMPAENYSYFLTLVRFRFAEFSRVELATV